MFFRRSTPKTPPAASGDPAVRTMTVGGRELPVLVRRNDRARRIGLRIDAHRDAIAVTVPTRASEADALAFLARHAEWAATQLDALPDRIPFAPGTVIPFLGEDRAIRHDPPARGGVFLEDAPEPAIVVTGHADHLPRRLTDFLKRRARAEIKPRAADMAGALGPDIATKLGRVTVRDQKTRWGSCTAAGALNFSWRLIYCPSSVLDYVVAHEVAHLRHMDHSRAFWDTVADLVPEAMASRAWLRAHGQRLHRIG